MVAVGPRAYRQEEPRAAQRVVPARKLGVERVLQRRGRHHFLDGAAGHDPAVLHEHDAVGELCGDVEIVHHDETGEAATLHFFGEQLVEVELMPHVQKGARLVQEKDLRLLRERARDGHALLLAARERVRRARRDSEQVAAPERLLDDGPVGVARLHPRTLMRSSSHHHHLAHREPHRELLDLLDDAELPRDLLPRTFRERLAKQDHLPPCRGKQTGGDTHEAGLTGTVRTEHANELTGRDLEVDVAEAQSIAMLVGRTDASQSKALGHDEVHRWRALWCMFAPVDDKGQPDNLAQAAGSDKARRVIKRYSNRKLYDTKDSRYVTLLQIAEMVRGGEEVQIIDNNTKEDLTEVTLAQIIYEEQKQKASSRNVPLQTLKELIHQRTEKVLSDLREGPIGRLIPGGTKSEPPRAEEEPAVASDESKPSLVDQAKGTLEDWQHKIDERVKAVVPNLLPWQQLQHEVKRLNARLDELETKLKSLTKE